MRLTPWAAATLAACGALVGSGCASPPRSRLAVPLKAEGVGAVETFGPGLVGTDDSGGTVTFALTASAGVAVVRVWPRWRVEPLYPTRDRDTTYFQTGVHVVQVSRPAPWDTLVVRPPAAAGQAAREEQAERCVSEELRRRQPPPERRNVAGAARRGQNPPAPTDYVDLAAITYQCRKAAGLADVAPAPRDSLVRRGSGYYIVLVASERAVDARHLREKLVGTDITLTDIVAVLQALPRFLAGERALNWAGYAAQVGGP
jgi:hypothetical protein